MTFPAAARTQYEELGYVVFRDVLDPSLVAEADAHVDWLLERNPELQPENLGHRLARNDPFWLRLVSDDRLLDVAQIFVGGDIALFATHYLCKPPRTGRPVLWHQDGAFWPLEPMEVTTLWLAVTATDPENGCLRVIPEPTRRRLQGCRSGRTSTAWSGARPTTWSTRRMRSSSSLGRATSSVHHPNILHASNANTSDRWRRALTIRYIPTSTRITDPNAASAFLLRGHAVEGVNAYLDRPDYRPGEHMAFAGAASP